MEEVGQGKSGTKKMSQSPKGLRKGKMNQSYPKYDLVCI